MNFRWYSMIVYVFASSMALLSGGVWADEISDAIGAIEGQAAELEEKAEFTQHQPEWVKGNQELVRFAREAWATAANLRAVVRALRGATIKFGNLPGSTQASTSFSTNPPTVTLDNSMQGASTAKIAQHLAHEGVHVIDGNPNNTSIDEEVLCYCKEAEVWNALKQPGETDKECDTVLRLKARGEAALRRAVRAAYPKLPPHPPK